MTLKKINSDASREPCDDNRKTRISRADHRHRIRNQIIAGGMAAFERDGFERTTIEQIAASIGVAARTIYRHFPTKADIVYQPLIPSIRAVTEFLMASPSSVPLDISLRNSIVSAIEFIERDRILLARHLELASSSSSLIATGRALADEATNDLRLELDKRYGPSRDPIATAIWAEITFTILFGARRAWLLQPEVPLRPAVENALDAAHSYSKMITSL